MIRDNGDVEGVENGGDETGAVENTQKQCDCRNVGFRMGIDIEMEMPEDATGQTLWEATVSSRLLQDKEKTSEVYGMLKPGGMGMGAIYRLGCIRRGEEYSPGILKVGQLLLLLHRLGRQQRKTA